MKIILPSYQILTPISENGLEETKFIERVARTCYKSEGKISPDGESAKKLVNSLIKSGHLAMLEHGHISVIFTCDRGVSHEIVRHRMASYAQESTRYCNYTKDAFGREITVIKPLYLKEDTEAYDDWHDTCLMAEATYFDLISRGYSPQQARAVLPTSLKTEIVMTANYREWMHFFKLRCAPAAHPQIRELAVPLRDELKEKMPYIFGAVEETE